MRIGIVGGGFSGSMLAVHLLRGARAPLEIVLVERTGRLGRGLAYGTQNPHHLLNVRASNMSAFDGDSSHFLRWLWARDQPGQAVPEVPPSGHAFVSRGLYGAYITDVLHEAIEAAAGTARLEIVPQAVIAMSRGDDGLRLATDEGASIAVDRAVLCVGNFPPALPGGLPAAFADDRRYVANPWDAGAFARIRPDEAVLVIGTGLTMVDFAVLLDEAGHRGRIDALSRRGLRPQRHEPVRRHAPFLDPAALPTRVADLMRRVRGEIDRAAAEGADWRGVIDALRPVTQALWVGMPTEERQRFMRHVRPYWEVHRHRLAPAIADRVATLEAEGRLATHAGRIERIDERARGRLGVIYRRRGDAARQTLVVDRVVNCSGPETDYRRIADPLVRGLLDAGLVRPDACRLGLDVGPDFELVDGSGAKDGRLFALGPPTRAAFWEITAVPDIRRQAEQLAARLLGAT